MPMTAWEAGKPGLLLSSGNARIGAVHGVDLHLGDHLAHLDGPTGSSLALVRGSTAGDDRSVLTCPLCSSDVDPHGPAVLRFRRDSAWSYMWQPFVEDLRTSAPGLLHPRCHVEDQGLDALLVLITASDKQQRASAFRAHQRIMELEQQLGSGD